MPVPYILVYCIIFIFFKIIYLFCTQTVIVIIINLCTGMTTLHFLSQSAFFSLSYDSALKSDNAHCTLPVRVVHLEYSNSVPVHITINL